MPPSPTPRFVLLLFFSSPLPQSSTGLTRTPRTLPRHLPTRPQRNNPTNYLVERALRRRIPKGSPAIATRDVAERETKERNATRKVPNSSLICCGCLRCRARRLSNPLRGLARLHGLCKHLFRRRRCLGRVARCASLPCADIDAPMRWYGGNRSLSLPPTTKGLQITCIVMNMTNHLIAFNV